MLKVFIKGSIWVDIELFVIKVKGRLIQGKAFQKKFGWCILEMNRKGLG